MDSTTETCVHGAPFASSTTKLFVGGRIPDSQPNFAPEFGTELVSFPCGSSQMGIKNRFVTPHWSDDELGMLGTPLFCVAKSQRKK